MLLVNITPEKFGQFDLFVESCGILSQRPVQLRSGRKAVGEVSCTIIKTQPIVLVALVADAEVVVAEDTEDVEEGGAVPRRRDRSETS